MITQIFASILITTAIVGYDIAHTPEKPVELITYAQEPQKLENYKVIDPPHVVEVPETVEGYIRYKFGEDADRALEIVECESKFNEKAFNDNTTWGGVGQDRGLWQINNKYHPVSDECAYDYKCSTDYAYRMYMNDDKNFNRWTCGR